MFCPEVFSRTWCISIPLGARQDPPDQHFMWTLCCSVHSADTRPIVLADSVLGPEHAMLLWSCRSQGAGGHTVQGLPPRILGFTSHLHAQLFRDLRWFWATDRLCGVRAPRRAGPVATSPYTYIRKGHLDAASSLGGVSVLCAWLVHVWRASALVTRKALALWEWDLEHWK